jgi:hypothetical protein
MHVKQRASLLFICFLLIASIQANAHNDETEAEYEYKQKLVLLQGKKSRLMAGDSRPNFNFNKKEVLPYYLARGWTIKYIYFNEASTTNNMHGYAVLEKWFKLNNRLSHKR